MKIVIIIYFNETEISTPGFAGTGYREESEIFNFEKE